MPRLLLNFCLAWVCIMTPPAFAQLSEQEFQELYERGNPGAQQPERPRDNQRDTPATVDESRSCWDAPEECLSVQPSWIGRNNKTFRVEVTNHCTGRIRVKVCTEINWWDRYDNTYLGNNHCASNGVRPGETQPYDTSPYKNPTGRYHVRWMGVNNHGEDWTCTSGQGWHEEPF